VSACRIRPGQHAAHGASDVIQSAIVVNYIAYAISAAASMLGPVVGGALLIWAGELFALRGEYSQFLFGFLIVVVVLRRATASSDDLSLVCASRPRVQGSLKAAPLRMPATTEPQP